MACWIFEQGQAAARHRSSLRDNNIPCMSRQAPVTSTSLAARARSCRCGPCQIEERPLSERPEPSICVCYVSMILPASTPRMNWTRMEVLTALPTNIWRHWETPHDAAIFFCFHGRRIGNPDPTFSVFCSASQQTLLCFEANGIPAAGAGT